jgi:putative oxidoreductase
LSQIPQAIHQNVKEISMNLTFQTSVLPLIARLFLAPLFILSGVAKLADPSETIAYIASSDAPLPQLGYVIALAVEVGGGLLLLLGYKTTYVAGVTALFSIAAAMMFHSNFADQNQMVHFLKNVAIAGGLLQVVAFGPGRFSLDGLRSKRAAVGSAAVA